MKLNLSMKDWINRLTLTCFLFIAGCEKHSDIEIIRAISLIPTQTDYAMDFRNWIEKVNERGEGKFKIIYVGGPEAVPTFAQADAVRNGVVHMVFGPATYYVGLLPEVEALFASNVPPWETRENGGVALMDKIHLERLKVRYLARATFIEFHLFTREHPRLQENGIPDLSQLLIRGGPSWRSFITSLQATYVNIAAPDIYTALERNMIDGVSWPLVGLADSSWDKHLSYRIDPGVFSSDVGLVFNAEKWGQLSESTRSILHDAALEYEINSYHRFKQLTDELDQSMREGGMQIVTLKDESAKRYQDLAADVLWQRLKERAPKYYDELHAKFYKE
jgi:TRAP-type transport system periplasmic protein